MNIDTLIDLMGNRLAEKIQDKRLPSYELSQEMEVYARLNYLKSEKENRNCEVKANGR